MRDAFGMDIGDVNGDGLPDVVASSPSQKQIYLFKQPNGDDNNDGVVDDATDVSPTREYDWDTFTLADFRDVDGLFPQDVRLVDLDGGGQLDVVMGDTAGGVRRLSPTPAGVFAEWIGSEIETLPVGGFIGRIGVGDVDADGDPDLGVVLDPTDPADFNDARILWIRTNR
jgi:hypothetical protein